MRRGHHYHGAGALGALSALLAGTAVAESASREPLALVDVTLVAVDAGRLIGQTHQLELRRRVASGELAGPRLCLAGPALGLDPEALPETPRIDTAVDARRAVREQHAAGYDLVKLLDRLSPEALEAALETARELGLPVSGHVPRAVGLERALASGLASVEHLSGILQALEADDSPLRGAQPAAWQRGVLDHLDESKVASLAALARRSGTAIVPTLDFWEALFPYASPDALLRRAGVEYLDWEYWSARLPDQLRFTLRHLAPREPEEAEP